MKLISILKEAYAFTIKGDKIKGSGDFNPDVEVLSTPDNVKLSQKIGNRTHIILLSKKQAKELKNSL
jgi:hypothetical protein